MPYCTLCRKSKRRTAFKSDASKRNGLSSWCKKCHSDYDKQRDRKSYYSANRERILKYTRRYTKENREAIIKRRRPYHARYRKEHREYFRWRSILKKYGLTKEQWLALFKAPGGRCAICGSRTSGRQIPWATDHSHKTGEARGILCHDCNLLIGYAYDSIKLLRKAIRYLRRNS